MDEMMETATGPLLLDFRGDCISFCKVHCYFGSTGGSGIIPLIQTIAADKRIDSAVQMN